MGADSAETLPRGWVRFRQAFPAALKTTEASEADSIAGSVDRTLSLIQQGVITVPTDTDFVSFVLSGGKQTNRSEPPAAKSAVTLAEIRDRGWVAAADVVRERCLEVAPKPGFDIDLDVPAAASS